MATSGAMRSAGRSAEVSRSASRVTASVVGMTGLGQSATPAPMTRAMPAAAASAGHQRGHDRWSEGPCPVGPAPSDPPFDALALGAEFGDATPVEPLFDAAPALDG